MEPEILRAKPATIEAFVDEEPRLAILSRTNCTTSCAGRRTR